MRWWAVLVLAGCGSGAYPRHSVDVDIEYTDGVTARFNRTDPTSYQFNGSGVAQIAWPSIAEYGGEEDQILVSFYPNVPGPQAVGYATVIDGGLRPAFSAMTTFDVRWRGDRDMPIELVAEVDDDSGGPLVQGSFTASDASCMTSTPTNTFTGCGEPIQGPTGATTWSATFEGCPAALVDAVLGGRDGETGSDRVRVGDVELDCVTTFNDDVICGRDTETVTVDGCDWDVFVYAAGRGAVAQGMEVRLTAGNACDAPTVCETAFVSGG